MCNISNSGHIHTHDITAFLIGREPGINSDHSRFAGHKQTALEHTGYPMMVLRAVCESANAELIARDVRRARANCAMFVRDKLSR